MDISVSEGLNPAHSLKVAGSNPAPAPNLFSCIRKVTEIFGFTADAARCRGMNLSERFRTCLGHEFWQRTVLLGEGHLSTASGCSAARGWSLYYCLVIPQNIHTNPDLPSINLETITLTFGRIR
jgi:hypothetical protein